MTPTFTTIAAGEARRRVAADHDLLRTTIRDRDEEELTAPYLVHDGPLGHFCDSLRDLVAHIMMWDEINLAVLTEARAGRAHWILHPHWEAPAAGTRLNRGGVVAGRALPVDLLLHRFGSVYEALLDELAGYEDRHWEAPLTIDHPAANSVGELAQYVMSVPGGEPFRHIGNHFGAPDEHG